MKPRWAAIAWWCLFLLLAGPSTAETRREAEGTGSPVRDIDPEALVRKLTVAVKHDAADRVLRLLDGVDAEELGFSPLHAAARHGSARVAEALLDAGFDVNAGVFKPLHSAAYNESLEVAALLIEHGTDVNASDFGWTPLHYALLVGRRTDHPGYPPGLRTANLLIERGADVFDGVGSDGDELFELVALQDQRGNIHPVVGIDWRTEYRGLCLDGKTGTHTAVFSHNCSGRSCFSTNTYFHYAEAAGTLVEAYVGYAAVREDGACSWREEKRKEGLEGLAGKDAWDAGERLFYQRRQALAEE